MNTQAKNSTHGPKYFVNIEGTEYEWEDSTITTEEIIELGNLPSDKGVICENPDGTERTLKPGEVVEIKPGHRYGRASSYKRG